MYEIDVEAEARQVLDERGDEERANLIERTAKAIFQAAMFGLRPLPEGTDLRELWNAELATSRIRYRNQARAALAASELLKRAEELELRITRAKGAVASALTTASDQPGATASMLREAARALDGQEIN